MNVLEILLKLRKHHLFAFFRIELTPFTVAHDAFLRLGTHYLEDFLLVITLDKLGHNLIINLNDLVFDALVIFILNLPPHEKSQILMVRAVNDLLPV